MKKSKILTIVLKIKNVVKKKSKHLHEPIFRGNEIKYLKIAIDKTAGKNELEAWNWLIKHIENYKKNLK